MRERDNEGTVGKGKRERKREKEKEKEITERKRDKWCPGTRYASYVLKRDQGPIHRV